MAPPATAAMFVETKVAEAGPALRFVPKAAKASEIARGLVERYGEGQQPRKSLDALQALLHRLRLVDYDWRQVTDADRFDVAWVLWEGAQPLAEHEAFLLDFLAWIEEPQRRYQAARLALNWAAAFDPRLPSIHTVAAWLGARRDRLPEPWSLLVTDFDIFSIARAPRRIASAFFDGDESVEAFFARLRLPSRAVKGGLGLEILAAATAALKEKTHVEPRLALRLCALASADRRLRADNGAIVTPRIAALRAAVADALLLPWQFREPPRDVKRVITAFLLDHYGDARVAAAGWRDVQAPATEIMRRWLTADSVAAYFRLARQTKAANAARLLERERFWLANLAGVDAAWLLTGPRNSPGAEFDRLARGRLGGCQPDQVALVLKFGGVTVLEASHAESEVVWLGGNPLAPRLFQSDDKIYWASALTRGADFSSAYGHKDGCAWQERLARYLALRAAA